MPRELEPDSAKRPPIPELLEAVEKILEGIPPPGEKAKNSVQSLENPTKEPPRADSTKETSPPPEQQAA